MTNESQHPIHTVTLAVTRMASSVQTGVGETGAEEGTLRIGTELGGSVRLGRGKIACSRGVNKTDRISVCSR
jgi:hypothetical protein